MIAKAAFVDNYDDIQEAKRLELKAPEPIISYDTLGFHLYEVSQFHKTDNGNIRIYLETGRDWTLKYDDNIWKTLMKQFAND